MKKIVALLLSIVMAGSLGACASETKETQPQAAKSTAAREETTPAVKDEPKVTLSLGCTSAAEDTATKAYERFAESVRERTGGSVTINVFPASQLGDAVAEMESMIAGAQDMFVESELTYLNNYGIKEYASESFGVVNTTEKLKTFLESDVAAKYREKFRENNGIVTVAYNYYRTPIVMATKTKLEKIEDFKGVKLRVVPSESTIAAYSAIGFNPTSVAYNEVYLSLSQGVIDGTIAPFEGIYTMKFYEQAPYILKLGVSVTNNAIWMNEAKWNQLSENQQQIIKECAVEAGEWYTEEISQAIQDYATTMEAAGAVISEPSKELLEECEEKWAAVGAEWTKEGKIPEGAYEEIRAAAAGE